MHPPGLPTMQVAALIVAIVACGGACAGGGAAPVRGDPASAPPSIETTVQRAVADAKGRVAAGTRVEVLSAERVTWSDHSLGCPVPGVLYAQALAPGYRIRIRAGDQVFDYHAGRAGSPFLCPPGRATPPLPDSST